MGIFNLFWEHALRVGMEFDAHFLPLALCVNRESESYNPFHNELMCHPPSSHLLSLFSLFCFILCYLAFPTLTS